MSKTTQKFKTDNTDQTGIITNLTGRNGKIAEVAYLKAINRGFAPGYELDDWLEAENELNFKQPDL